LLEGIDPVAFKASLDRLMANAEAMLATRAPADEHRDPATR
jgi:hypothetical protein